MWGQVVMFPILDTLPGLCHVNTGWGTANKDNVKEILRYKGIVLGGTNVVT